MSIQHTEKGAEKIGIEVDNASTGAFLTEEQRCYAVRRVDELCQEQEEAFLCCNANRLPFLHRPGISVDEKLVMLKEGKATPIDLSKKTKACQLPYQETTIWSAMYTFPKTEDQKAYDVALDKRTVFTKALHAKRQTAIDALMLGSGTSATTIVAGFGVGAPNPTIKVTK